MKLLKILLLVLLLGFLLEQLLPWWSIALAGGLSGLILGGHYGRSLLGGFLGAFLLWTGVAFMQVSATGSDLHARFGELLPGKPGGMTVILAAGVVGGLVAGLACLTGDAFRRVVAGKR